jgi:hypothetical protein
MGLSWADALEEVIGLEPPEDTLELRNNFLETCLLNKDGEGITQGEIHLTMQKYVYDFIKDNWGVQTRVMVMAPYNSGKSQQFPVGLLVYLSTLKPELEHLIISADAKLAKKRIVAIRAMVESKEYKYWCKINDLKPLKYDKKFDTGSMEVIVFESRNRTGNPSVEAHGVLTGGAGQRASYLWFDDICSTKDKNSPAHRRDVYDRAQNIWIKRLHDDGKVIGVMTPYHEEDANMRFCADGTFNVLKIAVNSDKSGYLVEIYNQEIDIEDEEYDD